MLDDVLHDDLIEALILERVGELVQVVDDVGVGLWRDIEADRAAPLRRSASDVQHRAGPHDEVELVRIRETVQQTARG